MVVHQGFQPLQNVLPESQNKFWWEEKGEFMWIYKEDLKGWFLKLFTIQILEWDKKKGCKMFF